MRSILDDITTQASNTFTEVTKENWSEWVDHWFKTAEDMKQIFLDEGLVNTAAIVQEHIDWQKKYIPHHISV